MSSHRIRSFDKGRFVPKSLPRPESKAEWKKKLLERKETLMHQESKETENKPYTSFENSACRLRSLTGNSKGGVMDCDSLEETLLKWKNHNKQFDAAKDGVKRKAESSIQGFKEGLYARNSSEPFDEDEDEDEAEISRKQEVKHEKIEEVTDSNRTKSSKNGDDYSQNLIEVTTDVKPLGTISTDDSRLREDGNYSCCQFQFSNGGDHLQCIKPSDLSPDLQNVDKHNYPHNFFTEETLDGRPLVAISSDDSALGQDGSCKHGKFEFSNDWNFQNVDGHDYSQDLLMEETFDVEELGTSSFGLRLDDDNDFVQFPLLNQAHFQNGRPSDLYYPLGNLEEEQEYLQNSLTENSFETPVGETSTDDFKLQREGNNDFSELMFSTAEDRRPCDLSCHFQKADEQSNLPNMLTEETLDIKRSGSNTDNSGLRQERATDFNQSGNSIVGQLQCGRSADLSQELQNPDTKLQENLHKIEETLLGVNDNFDFSSNNHDFGIEEQGLLDLWFPKLGF
ncbi:hypothetical protein F0562_015221 [Nyssa sinensis]|uniref:Uncharacterized protein n=1 Tax=Nyssa sinensis TaxID=561372 RepID=A0A5J4ZGQ1_9ASTE|nr:hypothetical protein F0562_015221 [Nyssa sinensis]